MPCLPGPVFQTVEEIEGVLGRDLYPSLAEERGRWEKELAGLREENESLTAMLCSKEEELHRTKAATNAVREERDRLRRRVSAGPGGGATRRRLLSQGRPEGSAALLVCEPPHLSGCAVSHS